MILEATEERQRKQGKASLVPSYTFAFVMIGPSIVQGCVALLDKWQKVQNTSKHTKWITISKITVVNVVTQLRGTTLRFISFLSLPPNVKAKIYFEGKASLLQSINHLLC